MTRDDEQRIVVGETGELIGPVSGLEVVVSPREENPQIIDLSVPPRHLTVSRDGLEGALGAMKTRENMRIVMAVATAGAAIFELSGLGGPRMRGFNRLLLVAGATVCAAIVAVNSSDGYNRLDDVGRALTANSNRQSTNLT